MSNLENAPTNPKSGVQRLGHFIPPANLLLEDEEPLFAAMADFACEFGGPITRLFVQSLPEEWKKEPLVIDTMLVWLTIGMFAGPIRFHREPYPLNDLGAFDNANADRQIEHISVMLGSAGMEALVGDLPSDLSEKPLRADLSPAKDRDLRLRGMLDKGEVSLARLEPGALFRYGSETYVRHLTAVEAGFHLFLRATRGSSQPLVNGFRTIVKG